MSFHTIVGQENAIRIIRGTIARSRIASSYLFAGEAGIGKKTVALTFAKALNCLAHRPAPQEADPDQPALLVPDAGAPAGAGSMAHAPERDSCDTCSSCRKIDAGSHPDIVLVVPTEGQIRIDEIRIADEALSFRPYEGRTKVVIIDDADRMNVAAANAFLKTLEEPPSDSIIILISSRPDRLLPTIRSRCSRINFRTLSADECRRVLEGRLPDAELDGAARLAMGRPGLALANDLIEEQNWFLDLLQNMLAAEKDGWAAREDMERWLEQALVLFRDLAVFGTSNSSSGLINPNADKIAAWSKTMNLEGIIKIYGKLSVLKGLLMFNLNKSITWNYTASLLRSELG